MPERETGNACIDGAKPSTRPCAVGWAEKGGDG